MVWSPSLFTSTGTALLKSSSEFGGLALVLPSIDTKRDNSALKMFSSSPHGQVRPSTELVMVVLTKFVTTGSSHNIIIVIENLPPSKTEAKIAQQRKSHLTSSRIDTTSCTIISLQDLHLPRSLRTEACSPATKTTIRIACIQQRRLSHPGA